jgi:type II secretory pathway pseudopilin PulG
MARNRGVSAAFVSNTSKSNRGFTLLELIGVLIAVGLLVAFLVPAQRNAREAARRSQCKNNLKQIALALHNYHDLYEAFPPAYTVDSKGKRLHSWRTLILPWMDQDPLYKKIDLSKAWDDPANAEAFNTEIMGYRCPSTDGPPKFTRYLAISGPKCFFDGAKARKIKDITDGTSKTLMIIEVDAEHAVHWMAPTDADENLILGLDEKSKLAHIGGMHVALGDGSIRFLSAKIGLDARRSMISINGAENICDDF